MDELDKSIQEHREQIEHCKHDNVMEYDDSLHCNDCNTVIAIICWSCAGSGDVYEDDYECDWINNSHRVITCPNCGGEGWEY